MTAFIAPAKLNLSLLVSPPRPDGYHPIRSMVQTVDWCDELTFSTDTDEDHLDIIGSDLPVEDNLVLRALEALRPGAKVPPLAIRLKKNIPEAAGLGGGSSDAAAVLAAAVAGGWVSSAEIDLVATQIGADVALFLVGGTMDVSGIGETIETLRGLDGFAVAVVVPEFGLATADVYRRWDEMEGPTGEQLPDDQLPPRLRGDRPMRNDLLPAALSLEPRLGDFMADVRSDWGTAIGMTGSGSACFGFFATVDEAAEAADSISDISRSGRGVSLRPQGVAEA